MQKNDKTGCDREHFMLCPDCESWFDMRDLANVIRHQHYLPLGIALDASHSKKSGKPGEIYSRIKGRMVTLRLAECKGRSDPKKSF